MTPLMSSSKKPPRTAKPSKLVDPPVDLWLRGGLLALILVVFATGLLFLAFRVWEPPELAKLLPQDTLHYQEGMMTATWGALSPEPIPGTKWLNGLAKISNETGLTSFYAAKSRFNKYRPTMILDEFRRFFRRYYVVAETPTTFDTLEQVSERKIPALSSDRFFQAIRPALPYRAPFFEFYRTGFWWAEKSDAFFSVVPFFESSKISLDNLAQTAFPLFGSVVKSTKVGKLTQTYVAGDKEFKTDESQYPYFFHLEKKYKGKLLPLLPDTITTLYGGEQLATTVAQLNDLLGTIEAKIDRLFTVYFGPALNRAQTLDPLLDNEYALGFFEPNEINPQPWIVAIELTPDTAPLLDQLVQTFLAQGLVQIDRENSSIKAEKLTPQRTEYNASLYDLYLRPSGQPFLAALIKDDVAILTTGKAEMEQVIDAMGGTGRYTESEKYRMIEPLIDKVDHLRAADATPDGGKTSAIGLPAAVGANLFDDGMMIFTHER